MNSSGTHHKYKGKSIYKMTKKEKKKFFIRQNKRNFRREKQSLKELGEKDEN